MKLRSNDVFLLFIYSINVFVCDGQVTIGSKLASFEMIE